MNKNAIFFKTDAGVLLKSTTRIFETRPEAEEYAHEIRTYVGEGHAYDRDWKQVGHIYYVPR